MQYLCLIYYDEKKLVNMPDAERNALYDEAYAQVCCLYDPGQSRVE